MGHTTRYDRPGGIRRTKLAVLTGLLGLLAAGGLAAWVILAVLTGSALAQTPGHWGLAQGVVVAQQATAPVVSDADVKAAWDAARAVYGADGLKSVATWGAIIFLLTQLLKWPRLGAVQKRIPERWRSFLPLVLAVAGGSIEAYLAGTPWVLAIGEALVGGGTAIALWEQGKGLIWGRAAG